MAEFIVNARKKSEDPVQEALRQNKDTWNHDASLLIAQLIAFKKGLNGRGDPRVGIPPGSIKDPMPNEVGSYLDQLSDRYSKLISDAHHIIDEQLNYSENRKKSVKEQTASDFDPEIIKIASWWGSRALTYLNNSDINNWRWFSTDEANNSRMLMLKISTDFIKQLKNIDNYIVSKEINAVPRAIYDFDKFISSFNKLLVPNIKKLVKLENSEDKNIKDTSKGVEKEPDSVIHERDDITTNDNAAEEPEEQILELSGKKSEELNAKDMLSDIVFTGKLIELMKLLEVNDYNIDLFKSAIKQLKKLLDNLFISKKGSLEEIYKLYSYAKEFSANLLNVKKGTFSEQMNDANKLIIAKAGMISGDFEKLAKNFLNRWLKRQKLKILPDSDDRIRLNASKKILNLIDLIDSFQNSLEEKEPYLNIIKQNFLAIGVEIGELSDDLFYLGKTHNDKYEQSRLNGKPTTHLIKQEALNRLKNLKTTLIDNLPSLIE